jgi:hypothetical protein
MNNHSIWGTGSLDAGCGIYNFTVWNTTSNPVRGSTNTINPVLTTGTPVLLNLESAQPSASTTTDKPSATKPSVGSTALGTSDSTILPASGLSLLGVALFFTCFL